MNEDLKNIETCLPESILAEVASVPTDAQFRSLVEESFDPLQQQALPPTAREAYQEVVDQHKPYTFTSQVKQMKSNLILLLRRLWRFPFGTGTLRSLSDMWSHYIHRLQGNETYGIPSRLSDLTDLPSAPLLVADRKISEPNAIDGISLAQLVCGYYGSLTKIEDTNHGWIMNKSVLSVFPNLTQITLNCKEAYVALGNVANLTLLRMPELELYDTYQSAMTSGEYKGTTADFRKLKETYSAILPNAPYLTENPFRDLETIHPRYAAQSMTILGNTAIDTIDLPNLKTVNASCWTCIIMGGSVRVIKCEALESCTSNYNGHSEYSAALIGGNLLDLEELWLGKLTGTGYITSNSASKANTPKLKKVVLGDGTSTSVTLNGWTPSAETIADADFLQNFRKYIAERLATFTANGPTLTLSQAVFSEIWDSQGNPQVKGDGLDDLRDDIHKIVRTRKHWEVNRA